MGVSLEGQTQDSIFSQWMSGVLSYELWGSELKRLQPLHGFIDPALPGPYSQSLSVLVPTPTTRPLTDHTNVIQSSQMLLGSRGRLSKVNSQCMTHISAPLPDLREDTTAEKKPVGVKVMWCVSVHSIRVQILRHTPSRFSIIIRLLGEQCQERCTDLCLSSALHRWGV